MRVSAASPSEAGRECGWDATHLVTTSRSAWIWHRARRTRWTTPRGGAGSTRFRRRRNCATRSPSGPSPGERLRLPA